MNYSQNNEEQYIIEYFKVYKGNFVDIGGFNPWKFSNTRRLYELGWSGAYVEPSTKCFKTFVDEYNSVERIKLFNFALGTHDGEVDFYETSDAISTTSTVHVKKWEGVANYELRKVEVKDVNTFLDQFDKIDFLSIDVESTNYELFSYIKDEYLANLQMLCIEHDNYHQQIESRMSAFGFKQLLINGENIILTK